MTRLERVAVVTGLSAAPGPAGARGRLCHPTVVGASSSRSASEAGEPSSSECGTRGARWSGTGPGATGRSSPPLSGRLPPLGVHGSRGQAGLSGGRRRSPLSPAVSWLLCRALSCLPVPYLSLRAPLAVPLDSLSNSIAVQHPCEDVSPSENACAPMGTSRSRGCCKRRISRLRGSRKQRLWVCRHTRAVGGGGRECVWCENP